MRIFETDTSANLFVYMPQNWITRLRPNSLLCYSVFLFLISSNVAGSVEEEGEPLRENRLANEQSPYLLQHKNNPVDWYPWGEEAFEKAKREHKAIFLSIGYSTCHWCHVMKRESFENEAVAEVLNKNFVAIKVDREERPDIDRIYLLFVQSLTGSAGWPLNVFLTPDRKPFFGGTYFPPTSSRGAIGFTDLLNRIAGMWKDDSDGMIANANNMSDSLLQFVESQPAAEGELTMQVADKAAEYFLREFDSEHGGFGPAPKFPMPSILSFLLQYGNAQPDPKWKELVTLTCDHMANGGIYDHIGGGFSRYTVDDQWLVPHFEKMLYDNAQLMDVYVDVFLETRNPRYLATAESIAEYVARDLTHEKGGFFCAEDAETEGEEGKFYVWTLRELEKLLSDQELEVLKKYYDISESGNFPDEASGDPTGRTILSLKGILMVAEDQDFLKSIKFKLFKARDERIRPHRDDKILVSWNGLMIGAFSKLYGVTGNTQYRDLADHSLSFIQQTMWNPDALKLYHRWRNGDRDDIQLLSAYAFLLHGVLGAYESTLNPDHLDFAVSLARGMIQRFYDETNGGFWVSEDDGSQIMRMKDEHDGPEPAANSVAIQALLKLASITEQSIFQEVAEHSLSYYHQTLMDRPEDLPFMLQSVVFSLTTPKRVVLSGPRGTAEHDALLRSVHNTYLPWKVVLGTEGAVEPFAKTLGSDTSQVFICHGKQCSLPTSEAEEIRLLLSERNSPKN